MESYNNTNHATVAVVDDLLHGILEFQLALFSDGSNFRGDAVIHQLFHSLAEDISLPDTVLRLRLIDKMDPGPAARFPQSERSLSRYLRGSYVWRGCWP